MAEERRFEYSHGRHIGADALRGLAVGIRGVLEAKRMAREAKSGREKRIADHYVRLKRLDLQERRLAISEGAAEREMEQVRLDSVEAEQEHKDEWHKRLAEAYDRLESLYRERKRAAAPKEMEQIDSEIAMEARAVVRLGKNLGYSYPHIEQGLKEREDAAVEFEEKSGRIDALDLSDERKAALHAALGNEFLGLRTGEEAKIDEVLGQLEAIEKLDETPEHKQELKDSYLNKEFGVAASVAEAAARKEEALQVLEKNKDAFSEQEYAGIKEQIELGKIADIGDFIKLLAEMDSVETEEEEETESEDAALDRPPKETDFKYTDADGAEYNLHAEVAYMIDIDGWSREKIKAQLQKDYPELSDEQIETVLNDPEFEYPGDN